MDDLLIALNQQSSMIEKLSERLNALTAEVMALRNQSTAPASTIVEWGEVEDAASILHRSPKTITAYRSRTIEDFHAKGESPWISGLHYRKTGKNTSKIVYNLVLLQDWFINRHNAAAHQKAIDKFLKKRK